MRVAFSKSHGVALAEELGIAEIICPPIPGAFSALGLVGSDLKRDYVRTVYTTSAKADPVLIEAAFQAMERDGNAMLDRARVQAQNRRFERSVDARYERQSYELSVAAPNSPIGSAAITAIANAFHDRHAQTYGHDNRSEPVQFVSLRVAAIGAIPPLVLRQETAKLASNPVKARRRVWFRATGAVEATIFDRARMPAGFTAAGPAVIESLESTILVPPAWRAHMDDAGYIWLTRSEAQDKGDAP